MTVVIKIELWPHGYRFMAKEIGRIHIVNDDSGDAEIGNYTVQIDHEDGKYNKGKIKGYDRTKPVYHLLAKALAACNIK